MPGSCGRLSNIISPAPAMPGRPRGLSGDARNANGNARRPAAVSDPDVLGPTIFQPENVAGTEWRIQSRSHPNRDGDHLVSLAAYGGRGKCDCMHWIAQVGPKVKQGQWLACVHIRIARERFMWWALTQAIANDPNRAHDQRECFDA
jgi:hypothetical protein